LIGVGVMRVGLAHLHCYIGLCDISSVSL